MRVARLTWQAADPAALGASLGARLGVVPLAAAAGRWRIALVDGDIEVVPWRREGAGDDPVAEGRLMFEPITDGGPDEEPGADARGSAPMALAGVAWATVELDRAEAELETYLGPATGGERAGPDGVPDAHLGARTRPRPTAGLPGEVLVLAEPNTEGRLAASLARDGEGPCAVYLRPGEGLGTWLAAARARGVDTSAIRDGPLGPSVLVLGAGVAGPHVVVVERPVPASPGAGAGTIAS